MVSEMLQRILRRFKKDDFEPILKKWEDTGQEILRKIDLAQTKQSTILSIIKLCEKRKISTRDVGVLDLIFTQFHSCRIKWSMYEFKKQPGESYDIVDSEEFENRLRKQMTLFFNFEMCVESYSGAIWTRLYVKENRFLQSNVIFIVYYPRTPFILLSKVKANHQDYILQSLMNMVDVSELRDCRLTGYHLDSLAQLGLNRHSQGGFSKYRLNEGTTNPLSLRRGQKRKHTEFDAIDDRIVCEYEQEHDKREEKLEETFGSYVQPTLERLVYRLETRFRGHEMIPGMEVSQEPFNCHVKFEGASVLEGIRNMATCGLATLPLPKHLGDVHSLARNHFVIGDKKRKT